MEFIWCAVANITDQPYIQDEEYHNGTRLFAPGGKCYVCGIRWGDGGERLYVVSRHRNGYQLIKAVVQSNMLTNWRVKQIFDPKVIKKLNWDSSDMSKRAAEHMVSIFIGRTNVK